MLCLALVHGAQANHDYPDLSVEAFHQKGALQKDDLSQIKLLEAPSLRVLKYEVITADKASPYPILYSAGAGPCVILSAYNSATRKALLTHMPDNVDLDSLSHALNKILVRGKKLHIHLIGCHKCSDSSNPDCITKGLARRAMVLLLRQFMGSDIDYHVVECGEQEHKMAIDARTGEVYKYFSHAKNEQNVCPDFDKRTHWAELLAQTPSRKPRDPTHVYQNKPKGKNSVDL